ncbi:hypothetical protein Micbo1qcDRAFT_157781 [Microdochium bolleyi]|uniref:Uncharacterized protein n=1 Tax=Microdochium bolleyi TaxID=196109 RepID=A0A136JF11_9PEZI|nr:hypothetical protein Micbo1qcDRAFT_157781 [Microdochium bolleyi]
MKINAILASAVLVSGTLGAQVPANVKRFYDSVRARGQCSNKLQSGLRLSDSASDRDNSDQPLYRLSH